MLITFLAGTAVSQAGPGFDPIEIRLVAPQPKGGPTVVVAGGDRTLEVEPRTLLGPSDFVSVGEVEWVAGEPGFNVTLTPTGGKKYERISTENVGRTLAIIIDGKILMTPKILDPVQAQGFLLTLNTEPEARELAAKIRQVVAPNERATSARRRQKAGSSRPKTAARGSVPSLAAVLTLPALLGVAEPSALWKSGAAQVSTARCER